MTVVEDPQRPRSRRCTARLRFVVVKEETRLALRNYDWLIRHCGPQELKLDWDSDTLVQPNRSVAVDNLCKRGFTPATR